MDLSFDDFFRKNEYKKTRGNAYKLLIPKSKLKFRREFFTNSIVKHWNTLKSSDINVESIHRFNKNVHKYFIRKKIW